MQPVDAPAYVGRQHTKVTADALLPLRVPWKCCAGCQSYQRVPIRSQGTSQVAKLTEELHT